MRNGTRRWLRPLAAGVMLIAALLLAACGGGGGGIEGGDDTGQVSTAMAEGEPSGTLAISNWPFYIDNKTVPDFEKATGISVKYTEDVNDNAEFFGKMQPLLDQGESGGRDIMIVTDWMANKMYDLGYLQDFDQEAVKPAMDNLVPALQSPSFDPNRDFSLPWQSGMTGLVVNTAEAPDIKSANDLFDPKYKGQVEMVSEMRDTVPIVMMADGIRPEDATKQDWLDTIEKLKEASESGQIRRFTGNNYTSDMANGDAIAVIGWSGDAIQLQADNPDIQFVMPAEGCSLWSDNMVIPVGAPNPTAAYAWMNYVYQPKNQAQITDYNYYFSPVEGVKPYLEKINPEAAKSPLIFPTEQYTKNCATQTDPPGSPEDVSEVEQAWQAVVTG
ncbi:MAG: spermidine/putrescine ABC transporter substrate-binding protein [Solirubrobacterales bacterium]